MDIDSKIFISVSKEELIAALTETYEAGWYGSLELKDSAVALVVNKLFEKRQNCINLSENLHTLLPLPENFHTLLPRHEPVDVLRIQGVNEQPNLQVQPSLSDVVMTFSSVASYGSVETYGQNSFITPSIIINNNDQTS